MKWSFLLFSSLLCLQAIAQYPATGNKARLGWQTTGDGLVYRGAIGDTTTLDPSGINNAWMLLDTASGNLYAYRAKAWRLVSGGGGGGLTMPFDSVTFNVNETDASLRELKYSEEKGYLQYGGQDSVQIPILPGIWYVRNDTSVTIPKGTVVRASGTLGASGRIKVKHMIANGSIDAMYVLGMAMQDIAVGADGYVMTQGKIRQFNTLAYSEGAVLYADVDTLGGLTQTEPGNGFLKLPIAFVVHSASNGTIAVRVTPGAYMRDLHDVEVTSPASNASLYYNTSEGIWRDTGAAVLVADTAAMLTNYINVVDTATMLSSYISNADTSVFARDFQISGTTNRLAMFTGANTVGNSNIYQNNNNIGVGVNPSYKFQMFFNNPTPGVQDTLMDLYSANWYPVGIRARVSNQIANGSYAIIGEALDGHYQENVGVYGLATKSDLSGPSSNIGVKGEVSGTYNALSTASGATFGGLFVNNVRKTLSSGNFNIGVRIITDSAGTYGIYQTGFGNNYFQSNTGIGTTSPARPLHVAGTSAVRIPAGTNAQQTGGDAGDLRLNTDDSNLRFYDNTGWRAVMQSSNTVGRGTAGRVFYADADGRVAGDEPLYWDATNNRLGINQATPIAPLDVVGGARFTQTVQALNFTGASIANGTTANNVFSISGNTASTGNTATNANITFDVGNSAGTRAMTILNNGLVGIGTASPTAKLTIRDSTGVPGLEINNSNADGRALALARNNTGNSIGFQMGGSNYIGGLLGNRADFYTQGASVVGFYLATNGETPTGGNTPIYIQPGGYFSTPTLTARPGNPGEVSVGGVADYGAYNLQCNGTGVWGAGAYVNGSDARIKENINDIGSSLNTVMKLKPVTFKYIESFSKDRAVQTGFIAQDLLSALEGKDYINGIVNQGGEYLSVAYQNLIPLLTKAMQEQQAQIEALKKEIEALKNK